MRITLSAALLCAVLAPAVLGAAPAPVPAPTAKGTPPPEIYHISVRPLCSALTTKIRPAIGMLLQNDRSIQQAPSLFKQYTDAAFSQSDARKSMSVYHMQNLVLPIADNLIAAQKLLNDPDVFPPVAQTEQDRQKLKLKQQVLKSLADQQAALDIINGFVETQNLSDMQHEGFGWIRSITDNGVASKNQGPNALDNIAPSTDPMHPAPFDDTVINAGLSPNPYEIDLTRIPGLALGFNPVNALRDGVVWTQGQVKQSEDSLAKSVDQTVKICNGQAPLAAPTSTP